MERVSDAQVLLLAAQLAASGEVKQLEGVAAARQDVLSPRIVYRILLTYLPIEGDSDTEAQLVTLLHGLEQDFSNYNALDAEHSFDSLEIPSAGNAEQALTHLRLDRVPIFDLTDSSDTLANFIIAWIHKIDGLSTLSTSSLQLAEHFTVSHPILKHWVDCFLRPLFRLRSDFYPGHHSDLSLQELETIHGQAGVAALLKLAVDSQDATNVSRDLAELVSPWVAGTTSAKRRRLDSVPDSRQDHRVVSYQDVNEWILSTAQKNYDLPANAVEQWPGPTFDQSDNSLSTSTSHHDAPAIAYIRTLLAMIYLTDDLDTTLRITVKKRLLHRAAILAQLMPPDLDNRLPDIPDIASLHAAPRSDLMKNNLLHSDNILTRPSSDVIDFLYGILSTQSLLQHFKLDTSTRSITTTVLFESSDRQRQELRALLAQIPRLTKSTLSWADTRHQILWLSTWWGDSQTQDHNVTAYLSRLSRDEVELQIIDAMLVAGAYSDVQQIYLASKDVPVVSTEVQKCIVDAIYAAYDNASNGNRTRGGVKKASEILHAFEGSFPDTDQFTHIEYLIKATHSLSFYHLTLHHGVPFQPVSIRVSSDPLSLIEKVLDQDNKAYTKLDDLLGIARNLVLADLPTPLPADYGPGEDVPLERRLVEAEHRITYSAITAALTDGDFDTAYSLITTRLGKSQLGSNDIADDTTWRAAYSAGRYRPSSSPQDLHKQIGSLQKRMELLSKALTLAPTPDPLPEILTAWRRCEDDLDELKRQALLEERAIDAQFDSQLPGAFGPTDRDLDNNETRRLIQARRTFNATGPSYEDEAPMGLFDVARGAASALRKNAFPLRGTGGNNGMQVKANVQSRQSMDNSARSSSDFDRPGSAEGPRVRKRDMLSSAVTGGLVSGMSWVLGAQPTGNPPPSQG